MMLVLSGEGPSDLGRCRTPAGLCSGDDFARGPLAVLLDQMLELKPKFRYRPIQTSADCVCFVPKAELLQRQKQRKERGGISLVGKKREQETGYFFTNAWMFGEIAVEQEQARNDRGIAVFHRDSDPTGSTHHSEWSDKSKSIKDGFLRAGYDRGVPMLPQPISEAWLLCMAKNYPPNAAALEDEAGNDKAANPLKDQLASAIGIENPSAEALADWLETTAVDATRLSTLPSFRAFSKDLDAALDRLLRTDGPARHAPT